MPLEACPPVLAEVAISWAGNPLRNFLGQFKLQIVVDLISVMSGEEAFAHMPAAADETAVRDGYPMGDVLGGGKIVHRMQQFPDDDRWSVGRGKDMPRPTVDADTESCSPR